MSALLKNFTPSDNEQEIINKWGSYGFLHGLPADTERHIAVAMEKAAIKLYNNDELSWLAVIAFPIVRRVMLGLKDKFESDKYYDINLAEFDVDFLIDTLAKHYPEHCKLDDELFKGLENVVDREAESVFFFCDKLIILIAVSKYRKI